MSTFNIKRGDLLPAFSFRLRNGDGTPPDMTGATVVMNMRDARTKALVITRGSVVVVDQPDASVRYDWTAPDTAVVGLFAAEFEVVFADGRAATYPNRGFIPVLIHDDLG